MSAERLPLLKAAYVIARRDFVAILFSRAFIFFLLGPLFPITVGALASGIGQRVESVTAAPEIGLAMQSDDADRMVAARDSLANQLGRAVPKMTVKQRLKPGEPYDARAVLAQREGSLAAIVTGTPAAPELTADAQGLERWEGLVALVAANAQRG